MPADNNAVCLPFTAPTGQVTLRQTLIHQGRRQLRSVSVYGNEAADAVSLGRGSSHWPFRQIRRVGGKALQAFKKAQVPHQSTELKADRLEFPS